MLEQRINVLSNEVVDYADAIGVLTNGITTVEGLAVMGAGQAYQVQQKWPETAEILGHKLMNEGNHVHLLLRVHKPPVNKKPTWLFSFPTKQHWKNKSNVQLIEQSARELLELANEQGWHEVFIPRPGCGMGGLSWDSVYPILDRFLDDRFVIVSL